MGIPCSPNSKTGIKYAWGNKAHWDPHEEKLPINRIG